MNAARAWMAAHQGVHVCACGCGQPIVIKIHHHKRGIPRFVNGHSSRVMNPMTGRHRSANPHWNGGRYINAEGYVLILDPHHQGAGRAPYVLEHRDVMERHLRRTLAPWEEVHHRNGNKADNRIQNLVLLSKQQHAQLHHRLIRAKVGEARYLASRLSMRRRKSYRRMLA